MYVCMCLNNTQEPKRATNNKWATFEDLAAVKAELAGVKAELAATNELLVNQQRDYKHLLASAVESIGAIAGGVSVLAAAVPPRKGRPPKPSEAQLTIGSMAAAAAAAGAGPSGSGSGGNEEEAQRLAVMLDAAAAEWHNRAMETQRAIASATYYIKQDVDSNGKPTKTICAFQLSPSPKLHAPRPGHVHKPLGTMFLPFAALARLGKDAKTVVAAGDLAARMAVCGHCKDVHACVPLNGGDTACLMCLKTRANGAFDSSCKEEIADKPGKQLVYLKNIVETVLLPFKYKYGHCDLRFLYDTRTSGSAPKNATYEKRFDIAVEATVGRIKLFIGIELVSTHDVQDSLAKKLEWIDGHVKLDPDYRAALLVFNTFAAHENTLKKGLSPIFVRTWLSALLEHADALPDNEVRILTFGLEEAQRNKDEYTEYEARHHGWGALPRDGAGHEFRYSMLHLEPRWVQAVATAAGLQLGLSVTMPDQL